VLIHSAAGGVGLAAIELAKTRDCVIFGTASPGKHAFLRDQGVKYPIASQGDYVAAVREGLVAEGAADKGLDLVLDPVGGRSWTEGYALLGAAGRLVAFGLSAASSGKQRSLLNAVGAILRVKRWSPTTLMDDNKTVSGVNMGHLFDRVDLLRPQFEALLALYGEGKIKPHVDRTFPFAEAAAAHHHIHDRKATGKVLLVP
jgi:NADPH:quinone reductase-like Zn-dependent oxidoreductase